MDRFAEILEAGGAVILPTETVYGIFAKALDEEAVNRVYALKGRPREKALNLNVASLADIQYFSQNPPFYLEKLYNRFMPGPLTIILKANNNVPFWINSGLDTVGFRLPSHEKTRMLLTALGPMIGPSANRSGKASGVCFDEIYQEFEGALEGLKDDQALTGQDSTILDLSSDKAKILRQGAITKADIQSALPEIAFE